MFEDFENRMGFWKNLGSNFTIQYSGDAPSFMTDSEMWQSMDSGTTQTLAAWENGWVLINNPDGTITANPKYTSGLPSETLTKVPIGFAPPTNTTPTSAGGGVVVAFNNEANLLDGYEVDSAGWTLQGINLDCPDIGANEKCDGTPFEEFTIRGYEGTGMDDERWWWVNANTLGLSNYDGGSKKSGSCEIHIREGYMVKLKVRFETEGEYGFMEDSFTDITTDSPGILETTTDSFTALMKGGDKLSIDIDSDWDDTARFYLKVQGADITDSNDSIDDEVYVTLEEVYVDTENPPNGGGGGLLGGLTGGSDNGGSGISPLIGIALIGVMGIVLLR